MTTIAELLRQASLSLSGVTPSPRMEAEILLAHALGKPRTHLLAWPQSEPAPAALGTFHKLLARRKLGEPVAYLVGAREFWSREFRLTSNVLIPRPDTELLVEKVLKKIPLRHPSTVADLGTGSGAIAVTVALERPACRVYATDRSLQALQVARSNARRLKAGNVGFIRSDWLDALADRHFDVIVSNPPYIAADDPHLEREIRFEPTEALTAGPDGLGAIRRITRQSPRCLRHGGWLLLEHGYDQASQVERLLAQSGFTTITCYRDLENRPRVTQAQWSP